MKIIFTFKFYISKTYSYLFELFIFMTFMPLNIALTSCLTEVTAFIFYKTNNFPFCLNKNRVTEIKKKKNQNSFSARQKSLGF